MNQKYLWSAIILLVLALAVVVIRCPMVKPKSLLAEAKYPPPGQGYVIARSGQPGGNHCACSLELNIAPDAATTKDGKVTLHINKTVDLGYGEETNWNGGAVN